jgi:hypothetical protein
MPADPSLLSERDARETSEGPSGQKSQLPPLSDLCKIVPYADEEEIRRS